MKILYVNPPFVKINKQFIEANYKFYTARDRMLTVLRKYLGKGFTNFLAKIGIERNEETGKIRYGVRAGSRWPFTLKHPNYKPYPYIMALSASYLKSFGYDVDIIDCVATEEFSYKNFLKKVKKSKPDIVVFEFAVITEEIDTKLAKEISQYSKIAFAGPNLTDDIISKFQKEYPFINFYLKGEYIINAKQMADTLKEGVYESEVVEDLDSIPYPYRDFDGIKNYYEPTMPTAKPQLCVYASKGCPFKCSFCQWPQMMYKGKVALRKPENIIKEIKEAVKKYGFKSILFDDDTFNLGPERISKLCDYLKEIGMPWTCMTRLDCATNELFDKMIDSGCIGLRLGVENFIVDVIKKKKKGLERSDFRATLEYLTKKYPNVYIHLTMMKNLPGQTEEIHQEDMRILRELGYSTDNLYRNYQLSSCVAYPGTLLYEELKKNNDLTNFTRSENYDGSDGGQTIMAQLNN